MTANYAISLVSQAITEILERWRKEGWRRGGESNPRIKVLQTSALPLGYRADHLPNIR
jgi:hypothetical protein